MIVNLGKKAYLRAHFIVLGYARYGRKEYKHIK